MGKACSRKARKRAKHGGQNKREDAPRYPNGRINYAEAGRQERDRPTATVIDARMRKWGLSEDVAKMPAAGTVFGRMYLQGELGPVGHDSGVAEAMYEAGQEFGRRRSAYLAAIAAPSSPRSGSDMGYMAEPPADEQLDHGPTRVREREDDYVERCNRARRRFAEIRRAVMDADAFGLFAIEMIVCEDKRTDDEQIMGSLRIALNAIARMLKAERRA